MQVKTAFQVAWDAAAGQLTNPRASTEELELAQIEAEEAWQQLQQSHGIAAGARQQLVAATNFAMSTGVFVLQSVA